MADTLGIRPNNPGIEQAYTQSIVSGIQQLGASLRNDLQTITTNKQLGNLSQQLQGIDPTSGDFAPRMMQAISQNPLALNTPAGKSAIGMLGSAHETYLRQKAAEEALNRQVQMFGMQQTALNSRDLQNFGQQKELAGMQNEFQETRDQRQLTNQQALEGMRSYNDMQQIEARAKLGTGRGAARDYAWELQVKSLQDSVKAEQEDLLDLEQKMAANNAAALADPDSAVAQETAKQVRLAAEHRARILKEKQARLDALMNQRVTEQPSIPSAVPPVEQGTGINLPMPDITMGMTDKIPGVSLGVGAQAPSILPTAAQLPAPKTRRTYNPATDEFN